MRRRDFFRRLGAIAGIVGVAGCSSNASEEPDAGTTARQPTRGATEEPPTERATTEPMLRRTTDEPTTVRTTTESTTTSTIRPTTAESTTVRTTTASTTTEMATPVPTPEPPANRLLLAPSLGAGWGYVDGSAPRVRANGTITALYRGTQEYTRTLRTRLWRCEGQMLDALGGTCSLGNLPDRYRAREDVETASPAVGDTAFAWWSGPRTDIEVVAADHVFRMTHTPRQADGPTGSLPSRESRLNALVEIARRQTEKLARLG